MDFSKLKNPAKAAEIIKEFKKQYSAKVCLAPQGDCQGKIISAHTLSVSSMLRPISDKNKVYALKVNLPPQPNQQPMELVLRGLRETSVFYGFCAKHDKDLFAPIEDYPFNCTREQIFTYAFRCVAKEAYLKRKQAESLPTPQDIASIHGITEEVVFSPLALLHQVASLQGAEEIERLKARLDQYFINQDFSRLQTTIFQFNTKPPIAASFVYAPDFDFEGKPLQDLGNFEADLSHIMVSLFPTDHGGFLLLSHEDKANKAPRLLIESLKTQEDLSSSITWLIACQTENFAISPTWFDSMSGPERESFMQGVYCNVSPFGSDFSSNNLKDNPMKVDDWEHQCTFTI